MNNIPVVKLGIVAVSRDCFPIVLSEKRRSAIKAAYKGDLYECPVTVENELDMLKAVEDVKKAPYKEVFFSDDATDDRWYKARLDFITIDEKTEKEKRNSVTYLVQAATLNGAVKNVDEVMNGTMIDYVISNISETKFMDVFEHAAKKAEE